MSSLSEKYRTLYAKAFREYHLTFRDGYFPGDRIKKQLVKAILLKK